MTLAHLVTHVVLHLMKTTEGHFISNKYQKIVDDTMKGREEAKQSVKIEFIEKPYWSSSSSTVKHPSELQKCIELGGREKNICKHLVCLL